MGATKTGMLGNASVLGAKSWALRILPQRKHHENEDLHQDKLDFSTKKHGDPGLSMLDFKQIGVMGGHYQTIRTFVTLGPLGKILSNSGSSPWGDLTSPVVQKKKNGLGTRDYRNDDNSLYILYMYKYIYIYIDILVAIG